MNNASPLCFADVDLNSKTLIDSVLKEHGENSCQHSFAAIYCTEDKYGDEFAFSDGVLYIHRAKLDDNEYRTYLAPMGEGDFVTAIDNVFKDAHSFGKKVKFESVTEAFAEKLKSLHADKFNFEACRDLAEYIYTFENLVTLPGHPHSPKRTGIARFWHEYGDKITIDDITEESVSEILEFQNKWLEEKINDTNRSQLIHEYTVIKRALLNLKVLDINGIVIKYDGRIYGYALGFPLSDNCFDEFIEKGDRSIGGDIYRVLNQEFVKRTCKNYEYINREEDLGISGLRQAKKSYQPAILLEKYIVKEV